MRVLVVGHGRSATSWVGSVLGATGGAAFVYEPDDARWVPFAIRAMARQGSLPVLRAEDRGSSQLTRLWDVAFGTRPVRYVRGQHRLSLKVLHSGNDDDRLGVISPDQRLTVRLRLAGLLGVPRHVGDPAVHHVVKSVRAPLMLDWIRARWNPTVVICFRHPLEVVASVLEAGFVGPTGKDLLERMSAAARSYGTDVYGVPEPTGDDPVAYTAWRVGLVMSALDDARRAHPEFHLVEHGVVCEDPVGRFRELAAALGLEWSSNAEELVVASNQPGGTFETRRVASEQKDRWRMRLPSEDVSTARHVLAQFPIATRYEADLRT